MTEQEWLASEDDPGRMLTAIEIDRSGRKLRLFACACCRQVWHLLTDDSPCPKCAGKGSHTTGQKRSRNHDTVACTNCNGSGRINRSQRAVEVAEQYADGKATEEELIAAWNAAGDAAWAVAWKDQAALLREIVGNPYRPVQVRQDWLTPQVLALARTAYEERPGEDGALDPARLAVLSDALEEAGCADEAILRHLRGWEPAVWGSDETGHPQKVQGWRSLRGPHVRGCWAVDLILGKD